MTHRVEICCFCEKVRDEDPGDPGAEVWQEFKTYMATRQLRQAEVRLWHTYCAPCLASYRKFLGTNSSVTESHDQKA